MSNASDDEFHNFMTGRWPSLLRTAYLLTGSHHDAEDLVQNALARAYVK
ncbi:sigma factor [Streptomyces virginiae]